MRGKNLIQILRAIDLIGRKSGATIAELQEHLGRDRTSIYRLITTLQELRFPIREERNPDDERIKIWMLEESFLTKLPNLSLPNLNLTLSEIIALYLLKSNAGMYQGTNIESILQSVFFKLDQYVPEQFARNIDRLQSVFIGTSKMTKDYSGKEEIINDLTRAVLRNRVCRIRYHAFLDDNEKQYRIEPLNFFVNNGGLYLFVRVPKYGDIRILAVERILSVTRTEESFDYPEDFDPEEKLATCFDLVLDQPVHARIRFSAYQAKYIRERRYAPTQKIIENKDGSIILDIETSGWNEIIRWVVRYGPEAEVLEPEALRDQVRDYLRSALENYSQGS
ncbi:MAG: helix-turn-helix transcriptional regulator [Desulfovibrionales bacterium]